MAYTPEQIAALPFKDPILRAKFAASQGIPSSLAVDPAAPPPPVNPLIAAVAPPAPAPEAAPAPFIPKAVESVGGGGPVSIAPEAPPLLPNVPAVGATPPVAPVAGVQTVGGKTIELGSSDPVNVAKAQAAMKPAGSGLPLTAPKAPGEPDPSLYKGVNPYTFGRNPYEAKLEGLAAKSAMGQAGYQEQAAAVDTQLAEDYSAQAQQIAADADAQAAVVAKKAEERKAFLGKFNADTQKAIDKYLSAEVDPGRFWAGSHGTANAIGATIGMFFAGIAGALDPSKDYVNQTMGRIEGKIQQDIDLQKAQIAKQGAGIEARRGLYASYLQQFGQEDAADAMSHEAYLRKVKTQVDAYAAKATSEKAKIGAQALSATLEDRIQQIGLTRQATGAKLYDDYQAQLAKQQAAAQAAALAPYKDEYEINKGVAKKAVETGGWAQWYPPGSQLPNGEIVKNPYGRHFVKDANGNIVDTGTLQAKAKAEGGGVVTVPIGVNAEGQPLFGTAVAKSAKDAEKINEVSTMYASIKKDLTTIRKLREKHSGGAIWSPEDQAEADAAAKNIQGTVKGPAWLQLGVLSGPDQKFLSAMVPDDPLEVKAVGAIGMDPIGKKLDAFESQLDTKMKTGVALHTTTGASAGGLPTKPVK